MIKNWKKILPLIGFLLLIYLLWHFEIKRIIQIFLSVNLWYLLFLPPIFFIIFLIQVLKWQIILKAQHINFPFWQLFKIHLIGTYYGFLTPGRVGHFLKAAYLKDRINKSIEECSSGILVDRFLDILVLFIFSIAGALVLISQFPFLLTRIIMVLIIVSLLFFIFYSKKRTRFLLKGLFNLLTPDKFKDKFRESFYLFYKNMPGKKILIRSFILTMVNWWLIYSQIFIIAKSLSININYFIFIFISALAISVGLLPITISGLGVREAAFIVLFKNYSILPEKLITMSLLSTVIGYLLLFLISSIFVFRFVKRKRQS